MAARFFLYRRNGVYYFRWSIPVACRLRMPVGSPDEVRLSLKTCNAITARHLVAKHWLAAIECSQRFLASNFLIRYNELVLAIQERVSMTDVGSSDDERLVTLASFLKSADIGRLQDAIAVLHGAGAELFIDAPAADVTIWRLAHDEDGNQIEEIVEVIDHFEDPNARLTRKGITAALAASKNVFALSEIHSDQLGMWAGAGESRRYHTLSLTRPVMCSVSSIRASASVLASLLPATTIPATAPGSITAPTQASDCDPILLSEARDIWIRDNSQRHGGEWTNSTEASYGSTVTQFIDIVGNKKTTELLAKDFQSFESLMKRLPRDWAAQRRRNGLTFDQLALTGSDKVQPKTLKDKGACLAGFFRYLQSKGYWHGRYGYSLFDKVKQRRKSTVIRHSFSDSDLQEIFCGKGKSTVANAKFPLYVWGSILLLYTGARSSEVSQLKRRDIVQSATGVWYCQFKEDIDGTDDPEPDGQVQTLKTEASVRSVPIHPAIIELGFISFIQKFSPPDSIFNEAYRHKQKVSKELGDWFNEKLLPAAGLKKPGVVLHSLRHTVINRLKHDASLAYLACAYTGHSTVADKDISNREFVNTYGKAFSPDLLAEKLHPLLDFVVDWQPVKEMLSNRGWA